MKVTDLDRATSIANEVKTIDSHLAMQGRRVNTVTIALTDGRHLYLPDRLIADVEAVWIDGLKTRRAQLVRIGHQIGLTGLDG